MKKRIISVILTLSMLFSMVPMMGIGVGAKTADQMTEAEAWLAGVDVYMAWYNNVKKIPLMTIIVIRIFHCYMMLFLRMIVKLKMKK